MLVWSTRIELAGKQRTVELSDGRLSIPLDGDNGMELAESLSSPGSTVDLLKDAALRLRAMSPKDRDRALAVFFTIATGERPNSATEEPPERREEDLERAAIMEFDGGLSREDADAASGASSAESPTPESSQEASGEAPSRPVPRDPGSPKTSHDGVQVPLTQRQGGEGPPGPEPAESPPAASDDPLSFFDTPPAEGGPEPPALIADPTPSPPMEIPSHIKKAKYSEIVRWLYSSCGVREPAAVLARLHELKASVPGLKRVALDESRVTATLQRLKDRSLVEASDEALTAV